MAKKENNIKNVVYDNVQHGYDKKAINKNQYLQELLDAVADLIVRIRIDGSIIDVSASCKNLVGMTSEQLCKTSIYELVHGSDCAMVRNCFASLSDADGGITCECRMKRMDGSIIWVEIRAQNIQDNNKKDIVAVFRDVSDRHHQMVDAEEQMRMLEHQFEVCNHQLMTTMELLRKQADERERYKLALEQSEMRYTALVDNTLTGIYIHNGSKVTYYNERFAQIFGFSHQTLEHVNIEELFAGRCMSELILSDFHKEEVVEAATSNGNKIWVKVSRTNLLINGQSLVIGNIIDITDQIVTNERLKESEKELHILSAQLIDAQELERKRIANELHDGLGQRLSAVKFAIENVCRLMDNENPAQHSQRLDKIVESIRDSIEEVRRVSMDLRPSMLDDLGLIATIGWFCREFSQLFPDIGIHRNISADEKDISEEIKVVIFRIIQEAFHNITKHAQADQIELELSSYNHSLRLMIRDNGRGISCLDSSPCSKGLGLKSMRERAELTKGEFKIDSVQGQGTMIYVQWPGTLD